MDLVRLARVAYTLVNGSTSYLHRTYLRIFDCQIVPTEAVS